MHSTIDSHRKHLQINSSYERPIVLEWHAKKSLSMYIKQNAVNFFNFHCLLKLLNAEQSLKLIPWMKVKCIIKFRKGVLERSEREYKKVQFTDPRCAKKLRTRSSKCQPLMDVNLGMLKPPYLPVSVAKKTDLLFSHKSWKSQIFHST